MEVQQHFGINRGSPGVAVGVAQLPVDKVETEATMDEAHQMVFGDLIFSAEVVNQRLRAGVLSHRAAQASENGDAAQPQELSSAYNLPALRSQASTQ
jgi:hypothetical protein